MSSSRFQASQMPHLLRNLTVVLLLHATDALAGQQSISLQSGWNLISFPSPPINASVTSVFAGPIAAGRLQSVWTYDPGQGDGSEGVWRVHATTLPPAGVDVLTTVQTGKGYWVRVSAATTVAYEIDEASAPEPPDTLVAGWNLVGFPVAEAELYDSVLSGAPVPQIWTYNPASGFLGVIKGANTNDLPLREDFLYIEPTRGYWVLSNADVSVAPVLATALPGDVDLPPLLTIPDNRPDVRVLFGDLSPGDVNVGANAGLPGDVFFDQPLTQRAMDFGRSDTRQSISVYNRGIGALQYLASIVDPEDHPWVRLAKEVTESETSTPEWLLLSAVGGTVTAGTDVYEVRVDRTGLVPGVYEATILVESNGDPDQEAQRTLLVRVEVPPFDGDYDLRAEIEQVELKPSSSAPSPRLRLSLQQHGSVLTGTFVGADSLLLPRDINLRGRVYSSRNEFTASGSANVPANDPGNPFGVPVRRAFSLVGSRPSVDQESDVALGTTDLVGEYFETIDGAMPYPIHLRGSFIAKQLTSVATGGAEAEGVNGGAGGLSDSEDPLVRNLPVNDNLRIEDVEVTVEIVHNRPSDLVVWLESPAGTRVELRNQLDSSAGRLTYDSEATPLEPLSKFDGEMSKGTWKLYIIDLPNAPVTVGTFKDAQILVRGAPVGTIRGSAPEDHEGAVVLLTGCGQTRQTTVAADGTYDFGDLVECQYRITIYRSGYQPVSISVYFQPGGAVEELTVGELEAGTVSSGPPVQPAPPSGPGYRFQAVSSSSFAGALAPAAALMFATDSATFDIDRAPLGAGSPGGADSNNFSPDYDCLTRANVLAASALLDPSASPGADCALSESQHAKAIVSIGSPVFGEGTSFSDTFGTPTGTGIDPLPVKMRAGTIW